MAKNDNRRRQLADAGLGVLAREGARGLTHRAVDTAAGVPAGTTSNYFRRREELVRGLVQRIYERLAPDPAVYAELATRPPSRELFADYVRDIVRRLTAAPDVTLALFELRLEAARRPGVGAVMAELLDSAFAADVAFNTEAGLPGGAREIALFHYAVDGLMFDRLTQSIDPETPTDDVVDALVRGVFGTDPA